MFTSSVSTAHSKIPAGHQVLGNDVLFQAVCAELPIADVKNLGRTCKVLSERANNPAIWARYYSPCTVLRPGGDNSLERRGIILTSIQNAALAPPVSARERNGDQRLRKYLGTYRGDAWYLVTGWAKHSYLSYNNAAMDHAVESAEYIFHKQGISDLFGSAYQRLGHDRNIAYFDLMSLYSRIQRGESIPIYPRRFIDDTRFKAILIAVYSASAGLVCTFMSPGNDYQPSLLRFIIGSACAVAHAATQNRGFIPELQMPWSAEDDRRKLISLAMLVGNIIEDDIGTTVLPQYKQGLNTHELQTH